jgi:23S rRNA (adenine2030-N6)-methyltransferase
MNYRHIYHAGSVADLFKHVVLLALLQNLARKDSPYFVLDSHAGIGLYNLHSIEADKTGEHHQGIDLLQQAVPVAPFLQDFMALVHAVNPTPDLRYYPGSPLITARCLRSLDKAACCELHPDDYVHLRRVLQPYPSAAVHHRDGYEAIRGLLPPVQKRGLILIDPPFEETNEFEQLTEAVRIGRNRFPAGSWAIWYPIKDRAAIWRFHEAMAKSVEYPQLAIEFMLRPETDARTLNGSGMLLIRPPYQFPETTLPALQELRQHLGLAPDGLRYEWIRPEA